MADAEHHLLFSESSVFCFLIRANAVLRKIFMFSGEFILSGTLGRHGLGCSAAALPRLTFELRNKACAHLPKRDDTHMLYFGVS